MFKVRDLNKLDNLTNPVAFRTGFAVSFISDVMVWNDAFACAFDATKAYLYPLSFWFFHVGYGV
jgi:hypothetical protein